MNATSAELIQYASSKLKEAGFQLYYTSRKTEACYYEFPGKDGLLRLSSHSARNHNMHYMRPVYSCLTFGDNFKPKTWDAVDAHIARSIGYLFMKHTKDNRANRERMKYFDSQEVA